LGHDYLKTFTAWSRVKGHPAPMIIFDIPYSPANGRWAVHASDGGHPNFKTRIDALRFAVGAALETHRGGEGALVTVEGVDGLRRAFDHQAKRVEKAPFSLH